MIMSFDPTKGQGQGHAKRSDSCEKIPVREETVLRAAQKREYSSRVNEHNR